MKIIKLLVCFFFTMILAACSGGGSSSSSSNSSNKLNYPTSQYTNASNTYFGTVVADPYQWMESTNSTETLAWVTQQNSFTDNYIQSLPEYNSVKSGLAALSQNDNALVNGVAQQDMIKVGNKYYYMNFNKTNDMKPEHSHHIDHVSTDNIIYVTDAKNHTGKVFLDLNKSGIVKGAESTVQFSVITDGGESYSVIRTQDTNLDISTIKVVNNDTQVTTKVISNVYGSYSVYSNGFFYVQATDITDIYTSTYNYQKLYYHQITGTTQDVSIFNGGQGLAISLDNIYNNIFYFYTGYANGNNIVYSFDPTNMQNTPRVFLAGDPPAIFSIYESSGQNLLIETNQGAIQKRLVLVDPSSPESSNWTNVLPANPSSDIVNYITNCGDYYYAEVLVNGASKLYRYNTTGALNPTEVDGFSGLGALITSGSGVPRCSNGVLTYLYSNLVTPYQTYSYDPTTQQVGMLQSETTVPGFNSANYEMKELFVPSTGGAQVSIFIGYKKGMQLNGNNPTLIYVYGGFNTSTLPNFDKNTVLLMNNGGIYVVAQVRGGGEYGTVWYDGGRLLNKQNTYNDVTAVANYLINNGYTSPTKLALSGASNGGLTTAAVALQQPGLFKVVFPAVGVLDLLRYQLFTIGYTWYPDFGYSSIQDQFNNQMTFSPLQNVKSVSYPTMLVQTGTEDGRVPPLHSYKFAATMQNAAGGTNPYLLRSYVGLGHNLSSTEVEVDKWTVFFNQTNTPIN